MRARCRMLLIVLAIVGLSCTGDEPAPTDVSSEPTSQPSSSASAEVSPLVGEWKRVTKCQELVQLLEANALGSQAPQAIEGNGWVDGTLEQLAEKVDPCEGAVPREHSHFFTEFGAFGSLDWRGEQVDEGTYRDRRRPHVHDRRRHVPFRHRGRHDKVRTRPARRMHRLRLRVDDRGRLPRLPMGAGRLTRVARTLDRSVSR